MVYILTASQWCLQTVAASTTTTTILTGTSLNDSTTTLATINTTVANFSTDSTDTPLNITISTVSSDSNTSSTAPNGTGNGTMTESQHQDGGGGYKGIEAVAAVCVVAICAVLIVVAVITGRLERQKQKLEIRAESNEFLNPSFNQPSTSNQAMTTL